ncbi:hypothetical protein GDO86_012361 [Hymenochirus boettgeri]|uniref:Kinesin-like protein n=1 Tax=Hymenochirus boettgeri TaxID=247094 RepID=A0A8T2ISB2_9PIPI|nr:hypothetical protein GDO86_012361 [Hymenochirus boettgeri]
MTMTATSSSEEGNVSVVVRVRPPNQREHEGNHHSVVHVVDENMLVFDPDEPDTPGVFSNLRGNDGSKRKGKDIKFIFDRVFGENSTQRNVFEHTTKEILDVFAYGATGSGKTHTMLGSEKDPGVMYLTMVELYKRIEAIKEEKICEVLISYLEVYNEQIQDLLEPSGSLAIREDPQKGIVVVQGLSFHQPNSAEQLLQMLASGNQNRTQHPTDANASSSRSHAVFQIYVKQQERTASITQDVRVAKMSLIDLAGSERASTTNAKGERLREGANINRSLLALINVINALADAKSKKGHIPYRDSKLTRLLKDSIGGNCRTVMIAAISPSSLSYDDTYNTLKYANRAKEIKLSMKSNVINLDCHISKYAAICEALKAEVEDLKAKLRFYQMTDQSGDGPTCSSPKDDAHPRSESCDLKSPEKESKNRALSKSSPQCRHHKLHGAKDSPLNKCNMEKSSVRVHEPFTVGSTERLVTCLLQFARKQRDILMHSGLQTPELEKELRELEHLALGNQDTITEKELKTEDRKVESNKKPKKEEILQQPLAEDINKEKTVDTGKKRKAGKRCRREILPDTSPSLRSPILPVKRRRQAESTPAKTALPLAPSTPEVQVKRPRRSAIPSRNHLNLRSSTGWLSSNGNELSVITTSSLNCPKIRNQTSDLQSQTVSKGRVPLGTSVFQNRVTTTPAALSARDLNTTFDVFEEDFVSDLDKTVTFGTTKFTDWENVVQNIDTTFGKSSNIAVFSMKHTNGSQLNSSTKSYSHKRRRSSSSSHMGKGLHSQSRIARLQMGTIKKLQQPPPIPENIPCSPRGQTGKRPGKGTTMFSRSLSSIPMTRFTQYAVSKS